MPLHGWGLISQLDWLWWGCIYIVTRMGWHNFWDFGIRKFWCKGIWKWEDFLVKVATVLPDMTEMWSIVGQRIDNKLAQVSPFPLPPFPFPYSPFPFPFPLPLPLPPPPPSELWFVEITHLSLYWEGKV